MNKMLLIAGIAIAASSVAYGQTKMPKKSKAEAQIVALEKQSWQEFKNKNSAWYQSHLADDFLQVHADGVLNKAQTVKFVAAGCDVKSFSFGKFKFVMLTKDSAMTTYTVTQNGVCNGKTLPTNVLESVVYVKRGGKWLQALYTEIPAEQ